jgi:hypothetical protein
MVVGLDCTHLPATAGARVGVTEPRETGDENVMLTSPFEAASCVPEAGEVARIERGAAAFAMVVAVAPPPLWPPEEDLSRP